MKDEKILQNELMNEEELEQVAGGNIGEVIADSKILYSHGLLNEIPKSCALPFTWVSETAKIDEAWSKAGITCVTNKFFDNEYYRDGKKISRDEARNFISQNYKKIREPYNAII